MSIGSVKRSLLLPTIICGLGAIFYCYEYFARISPSVMTAELMQTYGLNGAEFGTLSVFYYYAYVIMQIIVGPLLDRFGPRRLMTVSCLLSAIGIYLFAGRYGLLVAEIGRFILGFGSAFAFVGALKLATIWLPPNRFALMSGIILCLGMLGAMVGNILLRAMIDSIGWQETIYVTAIVGAVLSLGLWLVIRDVSPDHPNYHAHVIHLSEVLRGLWAALKNRQIWLNGLVGLLLYISLSSFAEVWGVSYLEQAQGLSKTHAANANSMSFLGWAVGGPVWGWFSEHIERRRLPIQIASVFALALVCILLYSPQLSVPVVYLVLFLFGFFSSAQVLVFSICREASQNNIAATSIAFTNMVVMLSGIIFLPLVGKLLDYGWAGAMVNGARVYPLAAYQQSLSVMPIGILMAFIILFFIRETHRSHVKK